MHAYVSPLLSLATQALKICPVLATTFNRRGGSSMSIHGFRIIVPEMSKLSVLVLWGMVFL